MRPLANIAGIARARYKHAMDATEESAVARNIDLPDPAATAALAGRIARMARRGDVIALEGALGAGKTTFARAFVATMAALRGLPADEVPSPTFTLVQLYPFDDLTVYHFDLYRIGHPEEAWELGIEEAFADGIALIEWPDRLGPILPPERLDIALLPGPAPDARVARLTPHGGWAARLDASADD